MTTRFLILFLIASVSPAFALTAKFFPQDVVGFTGISDDRILDIDSRGSTIVVASVSGGIDISIDRGITFSHRTKRNGLRDHCISNVHLTDQGALFARDCSGTTYRSNDGGNLFEVTSSAPEFVSHRQVSLGGRGQWKISQANGAGNLCYYFSKEQTSSDICLRLPSNSGRVKYTSVVATDWGEILAGTEKDGLLVFDPINVDGTLRTLKDSVLVLSTNSSPERVKLGYVYSIEPMSEVSVRLTLGFSYNDCKYVTWFPQVGSLEFIERSLVGCRETFVLEANAPSGARLRVSNQNQNLLYEGRLSVSLDAYSVLPLSEWRFTGETAWNQGAFSRSNTGGASFLSDFPF